MPLKKLIDYLEGEHIWFSRIVHSTGYSAQVTAHRAHISGDVLAKTIVLKDPDAHFLMAVVPANYQVDLDRISQRYGRRLELANEDEFETLFPGCETGAMPPFGNLFDLPVFASDTLARNEDIAFNAGNHRELLQVHFSDFKRLVNPTIASFSRRLC